MELVRPLDTFPEPSPLATARIKRRLSVEQAARRSGLAVDEVEWIEEGRLYRFPSQAAAVAAAAVYATALGIGRHEARKLAGLPTLPGGTINPLGRLIGAAAIAALLSALAVMVIAPNRGPATRTVVAASDPTLAPPWKISVTVLNGAGDITWTRQVASRVGAMAYRIERVGRADRFDYPRTAVYYEPGAEKIAVRLARQLGVSTRSLPAGSHGLQLVVIVGQHRGPG